MTNAEDMKESYQATTFKLAGSGARNVGVLKEALQNVDGQLASDMYGSGEVIEKFEQKMARILGKEAAVFFPSGTMAQQIALRIWSDQRNSLPAAYHPLAHLEIHEQDGLKKIHGMEPVLLGEANRLMRFSDVEKLGNSVSSILIELPQRELGGELPDFAELEAISDYSKQNGIFLHLDGARLFEVLPYYGKTSDQVCALFDSVYVSFYKGIGGVAGAVLAGTAAFTEEAKIWKRRYGGDLISLYPYILAADYYLEKRLPKMAGYFEASKALAKQFNALQDVKTRPEVPVSNMFHVHVSRETEEMQAIFTAVQEKTDVGIVANLRDGTSAGSCQFELSLGDAIQDISREKLEEVFLELAQALRK
ncbi:low specificity L-threonine aldolase [Listeria aquatica]|uniref:Low specificity L-threonine aldolase n=1 Tax=Listeria aquatica TaxID=1494960 RepID=A0A841ZMI3_9LIST|nr:beta-eliminating lyase-related protein [Listeria aquatica]MBC1521516.1 low specificity L-threonine aldolase [Listeria aquatica]